MQGVGQNGDPAALILIRSFDRLPVVETLVGPDAGFNDLREFMTWGVVLLSWVMFTLGPGACVITAHVILR